MEPASAKSGRLSRWAHAAAWLAGGFVIAAVLANVCIAAGAILALGLEGGTSRSFGMVINGAAIVLMIALYAGSLWGLASLLGSRWRIPSVAWAGLALFPALWLAIVAAAPPGAAAVTPTVVAAAGATLAWIAIRRNRRSSGADQQESVPG